MSRKRKRDQQSKPVAPPPRRTGVQPKSTDRELPVFTRGMAIFGGAGLMVALAGFFLLAQGSIALAPVLLAIAFLVFFPLALVK
ncbi:MAG: hypothetical protein WD056_01240 [Gemmatimonadota bacterium]